MARKFLPLAIMKQHLRKYFYNTMPKTLELSKELIIKSSITPEDKGCQDLMIDHLKPLGFDVEILNFDDVQNFYAKKGNASPLIVFAGHTDVVPPGPKDLSLIHI